MKVDGTPARRRRPPSPEGVMAAAARETGRLADVRDLSNGSHRHGDADAPDRDEVADRNHGGKLAFTPRQLLMEITAGIHLARWPICRHVSKLT